MTRHPAPLAWINLAWINFVGMGEVVDFCHAGPKSFKLIHAARRRAKLIHAARRRAKLIHAARRRAKLIHAARRRAWRGAGSQARFAASGASKSPHSSPRLDGATWP